MWLIYLIGLLINQVLLLTTLLLLALIVIWAITLDNLIVTTLG